MFLSKHFHQIPILIPLAVGVDNVFILLSAWRATNPNVELIERMSEAFGEAGVSITITSLTDVSYALKHNINLHKRSTT